MARGRGVPETGRTLDGLRMGLNLPAGRRNGYFGVVLAEFHAEFDSRAERDLQQALERTGLLLLGKFMASLRMLRSFMPSSDASASGRWRLSGRQTSTERHPTKVRTAGSRGSTSPFFARYARKSAWNSSSSSTTLETVLGAAATRLWPPACWLGSSQDCGRSRSWAIFIVGPAATVTRSR